MAAEEIDIEALPLLSISDLVDISIKPEDAEKLLVAAAPPAAPPPPVATPSTQECPLCMDGDREIALVPCGHVLCAGCAGRHATESCPMCRQDVASTMRVYFKVLLCVTRTGVGELRNYEGSTCWCLTAASCPSSALLCVKLMIRASR